MLAELNQKLAKAKEDFHFKKKWEKQLYELDTMRNELLQKLDNLLNRLKKEQKDVEKLERITLTNFVYSITGRKLEKEEKEKQELAEMQIRYQNKEQDLAKIEKQIANLKRRIESVKDAERKYFALLEEKEKVLYNLKTHWLDELEYLDTEIANLNIQRKEFQEAIKAGNDVIFSLTKAVDHLEEAKGWSTWDMFGGGTFATYIKHSALDTANDLITNAASQMRKFQLELEDIGELETLTVRIDGFLGFADYFLDNFFLDWTVHGKITDSLSETTGLLTKVKKLVSRLQETEENLERKFSELQMQRKDLIERAE